MSLVPEKGINFRVYHEGSALLGTAEGNFPNLEFMTSEIKGAGIAGTSESIVLGQLNAMTVSLTWRATTKEFPRILASKVHNLDMYASQQYFNSSTGQYETKQVHAYMKVVTKTGNIGNLVTGDLTGTQTEHNVYYLKLWIDGTEVAEIDIYNYICKINGVDYCAQVRADLGM